MKRTISNSDGLATERLVLAKRRYRVTADVIITVSDITATTVDSVLAGSRNYDEIVGEKWPWEQARASRELLQAIVKTPEVLDRLFKEKAAVEIEAGHSFSKVLRKAVSPDGLDEDEFVRPVLKTLSKPARALLEEAIDGRFYPEATEQIFHAIDSEVESVSVVDATSPE